VLFSLVQALAAHRSVDTAAAAVAVEARRDIVDFQAAENQLARIVEARQVEHIAAAHHMERHTADQVGQLPADIEVDHCALSDHIHTDCRTVASQVDASCRSP
jgi:hypothetical protein